MQYSTWNTRDFWAFLVCYLGELWVPPHIWFAWVSSSYGVTVSVDPLTTCPLTSKRLILFCASLFTDRSFSKKPSLKLLGWCDSLFWDSLAVCQWWSHCTAIVSLPAFLPVRRWVSDSVGSFSSSLYSQYLVPFLAHGRCFTNSHQRVVQSGLSLSRLWLRKQWINHKTVPRSGVVWNNISKWDSRYKVLNNVLKRSFLS